MWTATRGRGSAHVDAGGQWRGGQTPDFLVDVINGWPLMQGVGGNKVGFWTWMRDPWAET